MAGDKPIESDPIDSRAYNASIQLVKQPPTGNFVRYVGGNLTNAGITAGVHPDQAEVAAEGQFGANSAPANSLGWGNLNTNHYNLVGGVGGGNNSRVRIWPRIGQNGNNYTRMHLIHHALAANANHNVNNIVLGTPGFNNFHKNHVELFMGDSMARNFWNTSGGSLNAKLLAGENLGIAGGGHANAGTPYVVGLAPTFPASLRTGVILANNNGVPANARAITTDENVLDRHVVLWYEVVPVFGMTAANLYASMVNILNNQYLNNRPGAVQTAENVPAGILGGAGNMLFDMAAALAGIYATQLVVKASFYYPDPESIPLGGVTADNLPWREHRIPGRTLDNPDGNPYWQFNILYDTGGGALNVPAPTIAQL